jgi:PPOX class probable F420-dependent enzyme
MTRSQALVFLASGTRTGKLATVRPDGRPHVVPVWFVIDEDDIVFTTWHDTVKYRNMAVNPRAALTVDLEEPPYAFVSVEGTVEISDDVGELLRMATAIGGRYMGPDRAEEFGRRNGVEGEMLVRLSIDRIVARDDISG